MYRFCFAVALLASTAVGAHAQSTPPANPGPGNNAINRSDQNNPGAPVAGANSFTEGQAKSRLEQNGFTNISGLKKDDQGVWRGRASKNGKDVSVGLDFQGNIVSQ